MKLIDVHSHWGTRRGYPLQTGRNTGALMATLAVAAMSRLGLAASGAAKKKKQKKMKR